MLVLGIETSCDETAAALARSGKEILASVVSSQLGLHRKFGGVVPEIASRAHIELIFPAVRECLERAEKSPGDIDAVAATAGPGLAGALLVGLSAAKSLCFALEKPFIAINHIEAHVFSAFMEGDVRLPAVALAVSGGHTDLLLVEKIGKYRLLGRTRDDAAGEAFDKASKMLGLGYPGGPAIQKAAGSCEIPPIKFPRPLLPGTWDFSFSGLKTALLYHIRGNGISDVPGLACAFQSSAAETLTAKTLKAAEEFEAGSIIVAGGVAGNSLLRRLMAEKARKGGFSLFIPSMKLCTDNASMVAGLGAVKLDNGETFPLSTTADPGWKIGDKIEC